MVSDSFASHPFLYDSSSTPSFPIYMSGRCFFPHSPILPLLARQSFLCLFPFTLSIHLYFGLPFLLLPSTSILINLFPTYSSSLLVTRPYHLNLLSGTFLDNSPTSVLSFLIQPIFVTPHIHINCRTEFILYAKEDV